MHTDTISIPEEDLRERALELLEFPQVIERLVGTVEREKAAMGLFITLQEPTRGMRTEAVSAGYYHSDLWQTDFPKIQIRTVGELLEGREFEIPRHPQSYQPAQRITRPAGEQGRLEGPAGS